MSSALKSVFEYDNYRVFLKDKFAALKAADKKFSFRFFARLAGFNSHNTLWNVIDGRTNLSEASIEKICTALKLRQDESAHFKNLVMLNQAKTSELRAKFSQLILRSKAYRKAHPLKESQLNYYSQWYYVVIREMVNLPNFKEDPKWISENTMPRISERQAEEAIQELLKLGLLGRDGQGKLTQESAIVSTGDEVISALVAGFHREFMKKASESIDRIPRQKRDISSVTFRVSTETAQKIKEKIQNFRRELTAEAAGDPHPNAIYQLNLQLFPVTSIEGDDQ